VELFFRWAALIVIIVIRIDAKGALSFVMRSTGFCFFF